MQVTRIDHIHIKVNDQPKATALYEQVIGAKLLVEADFSDDSGIRIGYNPFPLGLELMEVTDTSKEMAKIYEPAPEGVFALSLKVPDIDKATEELEAMGHKLMMRYDFGEIKEALFDTKKALGVYIELISHPGEDASQVDDGGVSASGKVRSRTDEPPAGVQAAAPPASAQPAEPPASVQPAAPVQEPKKSLNFSVSSKVGDLMNNPAAKAVIDEFLPEAAGNPQTKMAYGMSLKMLASFPAAKISKALLAEIDARLRAL